MNPPRGKRRYLPLGSARTSRAADAAKEESSHERMRRLLLVIPYVIRNQGILLDDLALAVDIPKDILREDLPMLSMIGIPPYQPDDLIDIIVDDDETVRVNIDQRLGRPPTLTPGEGAALAAAWRLFSFANWPELKSASEKLVRALPPQAKVAYEELLRWIDLELPAPSAYEVIARALTLHRALHFRYYKYDEKSGISSEEREVEPWQLQNVQGTWYLSCFCRTKQEDRIFRLDRMQEVRIGSSNTQSPLSTKHSPEREYPIAKVRVRGAGIAYTQEKFRGVPQEVEPDGAVVFSLNLYTQLSLVSWVMSLGGLAEIISPESARREIAELASKLATRSPVSSFQLREDSEKIDP